MNVPAPPVAAFALVALAPLPLLGAGVLSGGAVLYLGLAYMVALAALLDHLIPLAIGDAPEEAEFPAADGLLALIAVLHLAALPLAVWAIAGPSPLGTAERTAAFVGFGLWFGQISIPAAHELIHRSGRGFYRLGVAIYVSLLFGHHASAHRLVHHRHAASAEDPNSARSGEGFYAFLLRAWPGSFRKGWLAETALRAKAGGTKGGIHPYAVYLGGAGLALGLAYGLAGGWGVLVWAGLAAHGQSQLLLSDYVQHYGLTRITRPDGRLEPVGPRHSWNAPHWFSSTLMLNAPRHSDHHTHPSRAFPALRLPPADQAPRLPYSLPVSCTIALVPPVWRRMMRPRLAEWRAAGALANP